MSSGRVTNFINENEMLRNENINSFVDATVGERCPSSCNNGIHKNHMHDCSIGTDDKDWRKNININVEYQIGQKIE